MPTVRVLVLRDGEPAQGHRVALSFEPIGGMLDEQTDSSGVAEFDVSDGQEGEVFVDGRKVDHWGSYTRRDLTIDL
jgi:hypothetical protein